MTAPQDAAGDGLARGFAPRPSPWRLARGRRVCKLPVSFRAWGEAVVPNKFLLQAVSIVPWVYAVFWYAATNSDAPNLAYWANWGWIAIIALEVLGFFAIRAQERRRQRLPPSPVNTEERQ